MPESVVDFFRMGGYAFYVWWAYAIVLVVLALNFVVPTLRHRRVTLALASDAGLMDRRGDEP